MVCLNHTDRTARRRCFLCKSPICPDCQHKAHHHVFCGESCARKFAQTGEAAATDLPTQLLLMDQGLTDDIREYGEQVHDQVSSSGWKGSWIRL
jgi:hypothetical protein